MWDSYKVLFEKKKKAQMGTSVHAVVKGGEVKEYYVQRDQSKWWEEGEKKHSVTDRRKIKKVQNMIVSTDSSSFFFTLTILNLNSPLKAWPCAVRRQTAAARRQDATYHQGTRWLFNFTLPVAETPVSGEHHNSSFSRGSRCPGEGVRRGEEGEGLVGVCLHCGCIWTSQCPEKSGFCSLRKIKK